MPGEHVLAACDFDTTTQGDHKLAAATLLTAAGVSVYALNGARGARWGRRAALAVLGGYGGVQAWGGWQLRRAGRADGYRAEVVEEAPHGRRWLVVTSGGVPHRVPCGAVRRVGGDTFWGMSSKSMSAWQPQAYRSKRHGMDVVVAAPGGNGAMVAVELAEAQPFRCEARPLKAELTADGATLSSTLLFGPLAAAGKDAFVAALEESVPAACERA